MTDTHHEIVTDGGVSKRVDPQKIPKGTGLDPYIVCDGCGTTPIWTTPSAFNRYKSGDEQWFCSGCSGNGGNDE